MAADLAGGGDEDDLHESDLEAFIPSLPRIDMAESR